MKIIRYIFYTFRANKIISLNKVTFNFFIHETITS